MISVLVVTQPSYLRYPHLHGDLITFTAEDDVWVAPLDGGRAWRVSADNMPVTRPRISPDGEHDRLDLHPGRGARGASSPRSTAARPAG